MVMWRVRGRGRRAHPARDNLCQHLGLNRLIQVIIHADNEAPISILLHGLPRHGDDRNAPARRVVRETHLALHFTFHL